MSFLYGTQVECLYAMPSAGAAVTAAAQTVLSKANAGGAGGGAYQLPAFFFNQNSGNGPGKSLLIKGGGFFTVGGTAVTDIFQVAFDTTAGTYASAGLIAETGTFTTLASITNGAFTFEVMVTCQATGGSSGILAAVGEVKFGAANNAWAGTIGTIGTSSTTLSALPIMIGAPNAGATSINTQQAYFIELFNTWSATTGSPSITLSNYLIFGLN